MVFNSSLENILRMQRALENVMANDWLGTSTSSRGGFPPVNVFKHDGSYVVIAELPGVARDDVDVEINRNKIRLSGRKRVDYGEQISMHRTERQAGEFDRTLTLPFEVGIDEVRAEYRDGMLALNLPPAESHKPHKVDIS